MKRGESIGAHYTPPDVAAFICREALAIWLGGAGGISAAAAARLIEGEDDFEPTPAEARQALGRLRALRAVDPACGEGAFLVALARVVARTWRSLDRMTTCVGGAVPDTWLSTHGLYGIELDAASAAVARRRVAQALAAPASPASPGTLLDERIIVGDALAAPAGPGRPDPAGAVAQTGPAPAATEIAARGFDIVLVNPPYENMVAMEARDGRNRRRLRETYATARGGFDLFVPFLERSLELLAPGGVIAAITPDKLLSAPYAAALRAHYRARVDLLALADLTGARAFAAGVYPVVTIGRRRPAGGGERSAAEETGGERDRRSASVRVYRPAEGPAPQGPERRPIRLVHEAPVAVLDRTGDRWAALLDSECDAITRAMGNLPRLAELAEVCGAATVAEAYAWQEAVIDDGGPLRAGDPERYAPFLVSGNVVAGGHTWPARPVRYLGRSYREPVLDTRHAAISARRRGQIMGAKLIVSGLARRPTCVWDAGGLAAGKSTVLVIPRPGVDGRALADVLLGDEVARFYRLLFGALSLAGGYMRFGPPQLRDLPVPVNRPG